MKRTLITVAAAGALLIGGRCGLRRDPLRQLGVIKACYDSGGNLRVIDESKTCGKGFTPLSWNAAGVPGAPGVWGYEVVRDEGTITGSAGTNFIAFSQGVDCPEGKRMLGWFAHGYMLPGSTAPARIDAASSDLFTDNDGQDYVSVEFTKGNGGQFVEGDTATGSSRRPAQRSADARSSASPGRLGGGRALLCAGEGWATGGHQ